MIPAMTMKNSADTDVHEPQLFVVHRGDPPVQRLRPGELAVNRNGPCSMGWSIVAIIHSLVERLQIGGYLI